MKKRNPICDSMLFFLYVAEEPFLILADHHEIRKLSVDGTNYTLLKQVSISDQHFSSDSSSEVPVEVPRKL